MREEDVIIEYEPHIAKLYEGRKTAEEILAEQKARWEAGREAREDLAAKKKAAVEELMALGVSKESAYLLANYYEEDVAREEAVAQAIFEASQIDKE